MSKFFKKHFSNILFILIIGLLLYTPTRVYFLRLVSFSPSVINTEQQVTIQKKSWFLKGLNTRDINLNKLEDKVIFISFWATWCPPCKAELPSIQELYNDYKDKVTFLFITNEDWFKVSDFYTENNYNLPTYHSISSIPKELESKTIPATFIINKKGNIIIDKKGAANWNSESVRKLLDESITQN